MIPSPILLNNDGIMICIVLCCVIILAIVMIPKAISHRKRVIENSITNQQNQEIEMKTVEENKKDKKGKHRLNYSETFLLTPKIVDRKTVFISKEIRDKLDRIARRLGDRKMSVSGFLENMANHHLKEYEDEINRLYKE